MSNPTMHFYTETTTRDKYYVEKAEYVSQYSNDPSTKTGAVFEIDDVTLVAEHNRTLPGHALLPERLARPEKYLWVEHAERRAIYKVVKRVGRLDGSTLYSNWWPCCECTRAAILSGVVRIVGFKPDFSHPKYGHEFEVSVQMCKESNVDVTFVGERDVKQQ